MVSLLKVWGFGLVLYVFKSCAVRRLRPGIEKVRKWLKAAITSLLQNAC